MALFTWRNFITGGTILVGIVVIGGLFMQAMVTHPTWWRYIGYTAVAFMTVVCACGIGMSVRKDTDGA